MSTYKSGKKNVRASFYPRLRNRDVKLERPDDLIEFAPPKIRLKGLDEKSYEGWKFLGRPPRKPDRNVQASDDDSPYAEIMVTVGRKMGEVLDDTSQKLAEKLGGVMEEGERLGSILEENANQLLERGRKKMETGISRLKDFFRN